LLFRQVRQQEDFPFPAATADQSQLQRRTIGVLPAELKKAKSPPGVVAVQGNQAAERTPPVDMARAKG
jgi:hypothetical protein